MLWDIRTNPSPFSAFSCSSLLSSPFIFFHFFLDTQTQTQSYTQLPLTLTNTIKYRSFLHEYVKSAAHLVHPPSCVVYPEVWTGLAACQSAAVSLSSQSRRPPASALCSWLEDSDNSDAQCRCCRCLHWMLYMVYNTFNTTLYEQNPNCCLDLAL